MGVVNLPSRPEFVGCIRGILEDVAKKFKKTGEDSNEVWTKEIIKRMNKYIKGIDKGANELVLWATGYNNEWLYDATFWYDSGDERRLFACAEIEWDINSEREHYDYQKVLVARTDIPIFITYAGSNGDAKKEREIRLEVAKQFKPNPKPVIFVLDEEWNWVSNVKKF